MTEATSDYVAAGVQAGINRASKYELEPTAGFEDSLGRIREVVESWPTELSGRFVELFVENAIVATIARGVYKDNPLTEDDLQEFLGHSTVFFNSFKHRQGGGRR